MNKHVNKLNKDASDARRLIEDFDSDSDKEMDSDGGGEGGGATSKKKSGSGNDGQEKPTEEQVEKLEEKLEAAQADQKNLFLIIFQR